MSQVAEVLERLAAGGLTVATAESLTGGLLAARLTGVPGSSRAFRGGVVAYAGDAKHSVLGVPAAVLEQYGAVSGECAQAMASGVRELLGASFGVSTTGVAGPDQQEGHPVGTVWLGVADASGSSARLLSLPGGREEVREATCREAVSLLAGILGREEQALG